MRPRAIVVVGSAPVLTEHLKRLCIGADLVICADGGADSALLAGIIPAMVVGDMDSMERDHLSVLRTLGVGIHEHSREKDQTDIELALALALDRRPKVVTLVGVLGGRRMDHGFGNLLLLTLAQHRRHAVRIDEGHTEAFILGQEGSIEGRPGEYVSLLPISPSVRGITTMGLRYALSGEVLLRGHTRGISNEMIASRASIRVGAGCLLVVHERMLAGSG